MSIIYILSLLLLMILFLLYPKKNKEVCILASIIYFIGFLFCYNTVIVYFSSLFSLGGSLLYYSLINFVVFFLLGVILIKKKSVQKYYFDRKKFIVLFCIIIITLLIGYVRFSGGNILSYESGDSAIHYKEALFFSEELELLDDKNSLDIIYGSFDRIMPISYINGGLFIKLCSFIPTYKAFILYDVLCFTLGSVLFLMTVFKVFKQKNNYFYQFIVTLLYVLAFVLNNLIFGFCYLGLGVMVVNLLLLTIIDINKRFDDNILEKLVFIFIINFTLFYAYYLFVPSTYLTLGLYYIYLWKKKKMTFRNLIIYGIITLIIPFGIGFLHFILPMFMPSDGGVGVEAVGQDGYIYNNITLMYLFFVFVWYLVNDYFRNKRKINYFNLCLYVLSGYIMIFFLLYLFRFSSLYYFYKLFYLYWIFFIILLGYRFISYKKYVYILFSLIVMGMVFVGVFPDSKVTSFMTKINIYNWNIRQFAKDKTLFNEGEFLLLEKSVEYKNICEYRDEFLVIGNPLKNIWFYSVVDSVPVLNHIVEDRSQFYRTNLSFRYWDNLSNYKCLVYFYEDKDISFQKEKYDILYENDEGVILKKLDSLN